jgi:hypothetical protein
MPKQKTGTYKLTLSAWEVLAIEKALWPAWDEMLRDNSAHAHWPSMQFLLGKIRNSAIEIRAMGAN